ncbi:regulatory protein RecX [Candidatus Gracilibacteria bacterium]|nr:regulatory protein RecX [Candidatus Gracilibacteria bacterium]
MLKYKNSKAYYLYLLAKKDYSLQELIDKAISKGYEDDDISESISELTKKNFINDTRYCQNIIEHYKNYKGPLWIKQKLISKKIPNTIINQELSKYNLIPSQNLKKKILNKYKIKNFIDLEMSTKQKIVSFLSRSGYNNPFDIISTWEDSDQSKQ